MRTLSVVIPCYSEAETLAEVFRYNVLEGR